MSDPTAAKPAADAVKSGDAGAAAAGADKKKEKKEKKPKEAKPKPAAKPAAEAGETLLGITKDPATDFSGWYAELIYKGELLHEYDVEGCFIMRPASYFMWEKIQEYLNARFGRHNVENAYFPMFVPKGALEKEEKHVADFTPEVAWVTRYGNKDLNEPLAIRPTSETVVCPAFAKWVRSHRALPLKVNQWCNVVRGEFSHATPFIRTREFLWQEGHTLHATEKGAMEEVLAILDYYGGVYEELLAVPVIKGDKTEHERFPGGVVTTTVETFVPRVGRGCQGATSHYLGQNFAKMFEIAYQDEDGSSAHPHQNSWGMTTRTIGVAVMVHSDEKGLVLPPFVAQTQVVIIPVGLTKKTAPEDEELVLRTATAVHRVLTSFGIRSKLDVRHYTVGWRFSDCELRGIPLRIEVGPRDVKAGAVAGQRRVDGQKFTLSLEGVDLGEKVEGQSAADAAADAAATLAVATPVDSALAFVKGQKGMPFATAVMDQLKDAHKAMLDRAIAERDARLTRTADWKEFVEALKVNNIIISAHCGVEECEEKVKERSRQETQTGVVDERAPSMGAKALCIPHAENKGTLPEGSKCIQCDKPAKYMVLWGRSF